MRIKVETVEGTRYKKEIHVHSLSYDCDLGRFLMEAGGYQIPADREYKPKRLYAQWDILFVIFAAKEEAEHFAVWLEKANIQAKDSFRTMPD